MTSWKCYFNVIKSIHQEKLIAHTHIKEFFPSKEKGKHLHGSDNSLKEPSWATCIQWGRKRGFYGQSSGQVDFTFSICFEFVTLICKFVEED